LSSSIPLISGGVDFEAVRGEGAYLISQGDRFMAQYAPSRMGWLLAILLHARLPVKFVLVAAFIPMAVLVAFVYLDLRHMGQGKNYEPNSLLGGSSSAAEH